jgi:predicted RNA-binding Zn-ribbon protein involved in translation (DUF1610 family)
MREGVMVQVKCDDCEQRFEVEAAVEGQKVRCPSCGDVHIIRGATPRVPEAVATRRDRAAEAGFPPAFGEEAEVLTVKPAMFRAKPIECLMLTIAVVAGAGGAAWFGSSGNQWAAIGCGAGSLAAAAVLAWWRLVKRTTSLRITTKRTVETVGLFSKATSEILHKDIRNFTVTQSFWERLWNVGRIGIDSAADDSQEIVMQDVPKPREVHRVIDLYRPM